LRRGEGQKRFVGLPLPFSGGKRSLYGCAMGDDEKCVIVYSFDTPALARKQHRNYDAKIKSNVFRHEQGHCNGWPANHPNARP
jgi:hypothetical protein